MLYTQITVNTYCFFYIAFIYYIPYLFWRKNERGGYVENITTLAYTPPATVNSSDAAGVSPEGARGIPGMCDHTVYAADSLDEWWASPKERGGFHE